VPQKTHTVQRPIGDRRAPQPNKLPGFIRVDRVHQGDLDGITILRLGPQSLSRRPPPYYTPQMHQNRKQQAAADLLPANAVFGNQILVADE